MQLSRSILYISAQSSTIQSLTNAAGIKDDCDWVRQAIEADCSITVSTARAGIDPLPTPSCFAGVIIGGSSRSVNEDTETVNSLRAWITQSLIERTRLLGICFGHQLILHTLGARLRARDGGRHFGIDRIQLTCDGQNDWLFRNLPSAFPASTGHSDEITSISGIREATVLATSQHCPIEAVAIGRSVRTVQFHPEITAETLGRIANIMQYHKVTEDKPLGGTEEELCSVPSEKPDAYGHQVLRNFRQECCS